MIISSSITESCDDTDVFFFDCQDMTSYTMHEDWERLKQSHNKLLLTQVRNLTVKEWTELWKKYWKVSRIISNSD